MREPLTLQADAELLHTALLQLLENASKYSDPGSPVTISVEKQPSSIQISIHSIGRPIAGEERGLVFHRYYRGRDAFGSSGTGLGLSITQKVTEAHHGRAWLKGNMDSGNTFVLELPFSVNTAHERVFRAHTDS